MKLRGRRGYSLMETMFALAIMAMAAAMIMPKAAGALDQVVAHTVFFDFQRQVLDVRREAFAKAQPSIIISTYQGQSSTQEAEAATASRAEPVRITLRSGWTYQLSAPIRIGAGGACSQSDVDLYDSGRKIFHLEGRDVGCRFTRVA